MARGTHGIPPQFDIEFLHWFRQRTETTWATLPVRTSQEVLSGFVEAGVGGSEWQSGTRWLDGLSDTEIGEVEQRWKLAFPPDFRLFLRHLHSVDRPMLCAHFALADDPADAEELNRALAVSLVHEYGQYMVLEESPSFYNWLIGTTALEGRYAWLWEGIQFDVEHNVLWPPSWGTKPASLDAQKVRARELVEAAPRLIPVFAHRYLLSQPCVAGYPVLSAWQSDIIVYGADLRDYLLVEFADLLGLDEEDVRTVQKSTTAHINERFSQFCAIPFWGEFL